MISLSLFMIMNTRDKEITDQPTGSRGVLFDRISSL